MAIRIVEIKQLGIGWEVWFLPPDQEDAVRTFLEGQDLRVVQARRDTLPEVGEIGSVTCEHPGGEVLKAELVKLLVENGDFEVSEHLTE